jgi:hypothetical protein
MIVMVNLIEKQTRLCVISGLLYRKYKISRTENFKRATPDTGHCDTFPKKCSFSGSVSFSVENETTVLVYR